MFSAQLRVKVWVLAYLGVEGERHLGILHTDHGVVELSNFQM